MCGYAVCASPYRLLIRGVIAALKATVHLIRCPVSSSHRCDDCRGAGFEIGTRIGLGVDSHVMVATRSVDFRKGFDASAADKWINDLAVKFPTGRYALLVVYRAGWSSPPGSLSPTPYCRATCRLTAQNLIRLSRSGGIYLKAVFPHRLFDPIDDAVDTCCNAREALLAKPGTRHKPRSLQLSMTSQPFEEIVSNGLRAA